MEFWLRFFFCQFDDIHFIQLLLTGHGHIPGGNTCLIAGDEVLEIPDLLLLAIVGSF